MSLRFLIAACLLGTAALSHPARAQEPSLRGPWLGGGVGAASTQVNCDLCTNDRNGGLSGYLTGGIALGPGVRAGAELAGWFDTTDGVRQRLMLYGVSVYWRPRPANSSWYLKGGVGLLQYHADTVNDDDDDPLKASAAALQVGGGYDLRAGSKLWLTPFANLIVSTSGNLTSGNSVVTDASFSMLQIGAGLTWR